MILATSGGNDGAGTLPPDLGVLSIARWQWRYYASALGPTVDGRIKPDVMAQGECGCV
jgi:hypothetical protein